MYSKKHLFTNNVLFTLLTLPFTFISLSAAEYYNQNYYYYNQPYQGGYNQYGYYGGQDGQYSNGQSCNGPACNAQGCNGQSCNAQGCNGQSCNAQGCGPKGCNTGGGSVCAGGACADLGYSRFYGRPCYQHPYYHDNFPNNCGEETHSYPYDGSFYYSVYPYLDGF